MPRRPDDRPTVSTGISGLDDILAGGLPAGRLYLLQGDPGTGKTTVAVQFLLEGVRAGEPVVYVTLSETRDELDSTRPTRVVFVSLSEMRLLARDPLRYRRLILSLKQRLVDRTTVLLLD